MPSIVRIPITNRYLGGDYSGRILVGPQKTPMNVILDTGSSALALDGHKYRPDIAGGDKATKIAQFSSYGDKSHWTGAVITTTVAVGDGSSQITLPGANASVTYDQSTNMFRQADGILGLAYAPLDEGFTMPDLTWPKKYTTQQVVQGSLAQVVPYLTQLDSHDVVSDIVSFYTLRSFAHKGGGANDPLNNGWMILGGGQESTDLYTGPFQTVKVLADQWYNTNLRAIKVGTSIIEVRTRTLKGMPSNSIVDSGTNSLNFGIRLLQAILAKLNATQQSQLAASLQGRLVAVSDLNLASWPDLTFVLQGDTGDVSLVVQPRDYWQVNTEAVGAALAAITPGNDGLAILGLPLMNGYFTVFDGEADNGRGVIRFAPSKRQA
jgi:aspartyl protease